MSRTDRAAVALIFTVLWSCGPRTDPAPSTDVGLPVPDMNDMEPQVAQRLRQLADAVRADPESAEAWGRYGMVLHAHELLDEASPTYARARELDPDDGRWAYYHGDVLSLIGSDLEAAIEAFQGFLEKRPNYAPGHMRLGKALVAANRPGEASAELERALELAPELQPARVALAQLLLAEGQIERAEELLQAVLATAPRHEQALTTLSQIYMRQGRPDEAREVARRSSSAAAYNLYDDPLMSEVVAEELSSVQIWERAKSFLDNGNYQQAAIGLTRVVELTPDNAGAHLQLAVALGHLGRLDQAVQHLERSVHLQPESADARRRLGALYLQLNRGDSALEELRASLDIDAESVETYWLLGSALLQTGRPAEAIDTFRQAAAEEDSVPAQTRINWGNALAQTGRADAALAHFESVLREDPDNPQALFFAGLVHEGKGDIARARELYCRSLSHDPRSPAGQRIQAIQVACG